MHNLSRRAVSVIFHTCVIPVILLGLSMTSAYGQFRIQVASAPRYYTVEQIQSELGLKEPLVVYNLNGRFKYFSGNYPTQEAAQAALPSVKVQGAWVVRIPDNAVPYGQTEVPAQVQTPPKTAPNQRPPAQSQETIKLEQVYGIQIAASKVYLRPSSFQQKLGLTDEVRYFRKDGWYKYVVGRFSTEKEASDRLGVLRIDGFVTAYQDTVKVETPVTEEKIVTPPADTLQQPADTTVVTQDSIPSVTDTLPRGSEAEIRALYNERLLEAQQAKNEGDLILARKLYTEASKIDPGKVFPKNEIEEIDRLLRDQQTKPLFKQTSTVVYGIIAFVAVMIIVLVVTLILRTRRQRLDRQKQRLREQYQDSITEYLFDETAAHPETLHEIDSQRKKQILIDEIMQLYANLSGEISNKLRELYLDLGLDNESVQKTKSPQWHIRAKGFRELAQMNIQTVNDEIERCLNSTNDILRMEAQLAMIRLNFEDPFSFLDKLEQPFTAWEQLHVYEMINRYQIAVPDFTRWLKSPNESIVLFAIRMIRAYKQDSAFPKLVPFLQHSNYEIREETFMALGDLGNLEALALLKDRYGYEAQPGRVQIIKAIGKLPDESNVEFLRGVLEPSSELRLEAAEALSRIESFGVKGIETILRRSDEDLQAVARHILDNKISR